MKKTILITNAIIFLEAFSIAQNTVTVSQDINQTNNGTILPCERNDATIKTYKVGTSPNIISVIFYLF